MIIYHYKPMTFPHDARCGCLKPPYPERNPEVDFFVSGSWNCILPRVRQELWADALSDTTNDPDGFELTTH